MQISDFNSSNPQVRGPLGNTGVQPEVAPSVEIAETSSGRVDRSVNHYLSKAGEDAERLQSSPIQIAPPSKPPSPEAAAARQELGFGSEVEVGDYSKDRSQGTLIGLLGQRGFSQKEIYARTASGATFLQRVADANELKNPDLIQPGQKLWLPLKLRDGDKIAPDFDLSPPEPPWGKSHPNAF